MEEILTIKMLKSHETLHQNNINIYSIIMNLYIKDKVTRKIAAILVAFPAWVFLMYCLVQFAVFCCEYLGIVGCIPPLILAFYIYYLIETKIQKQRNVRIAQKRRSEAERIRKRNYQEQGILDQYETLR